MSKRILLADDSITIQKVVELTFSDGDFDVLSVSNGEQALTKAREFKPDIALLDVIMPEKNGYEVCQLLKQDSELRHIPVLLLTGTFESFDRTRADEVGADGYLTKPFESQMLISKVEELLASTPRQVAPSKQSGPMQVVTSGTILNVDQPAPEAPAPRPAPVAHEPPPAPPAQEAAPPPEPTKAEPPPVEAPPPDVGAAESPHRADGPQPAASPPPFSSDPFPPLEPEPASESADAPPVDLPPAGASAVEPPPAPIDDDILMKDEGPPAAPPEPAAAAEPGPAVEPPAPPAPPAPARPEAEQAYEQTFDLPGETDTIALAGRRPAEQLGPGTLYSGPQPQPTPPPGTPQTLTPEQIDDIARRVVERLSDQVIREVAWEVIPDLAEILIRKRISELERDGERRG